MCSGRARSGHSRRKSLPAGIRSVVQNPLCSSGTYMVSGTNSTERIVWLAGEAGTNLVDNTLMGAKDISSTMLSAISNTTAATDATAPTIEPNFWIKRATLKYTCVNNSQVSGRRPPYDYRSILLFGRILTWPVIRMGISPLISSTTKLWSQRPLRLGLPSGRLQPSGGPRLPTVNFVRCSGSSNPGRCFFKAASPIHSSSGCHGRSI